MKPFNLDDALAGEPVLLRDGSKGYVKYVLPYSQGTNDELQGYYESKDHDGECVFMTSWHSTGKAYHHSNTSTDIICMWEEVFITLDGTHLPKPIDNPKDAYYFINANFEVERQVIDLIQHNPRRITAGNCFKTSEDAQMWADYFGQMLKGAK